MSVMQRLAKGYRRNPLLTEVAAFFILALLVLWGSLSLDQRLLPVPASEGLLVIFVATLTSMWGLANTLRIYRELSSRVSSIDELLDKLCQELHDMTEVAEKSARSRASLYFYMYVRVPALGSISANPEKAKLFTNRLKNAAQWVDVRIICLEKESLAKFVEDFFGSGSAETNEVIRDSYDLCAELERKNMIIYEKSVFNSYRVVTRWAWFEFAMTAVTNGRQETRGREDRSPFGVEFAKRAFVEYWNDITSNPRVDSASSQKPVNTLPPDSDLNGHAQVSEDEVLSRDVIPEQ